LAFFEILQISVVVNVKNFSGSKDKRNGKKGQKSHDWVKEVATARQFAFHFAEAEHRFCRSTTRSHCYRALLSERP